MQRVVDKTRGVVRIRVETVFQAEFFNRCAREGIPVRRLRRRGPDCLEAEVTVRDFKRLRPVMRACQGRCRIVRRRGLPFLLRHLRGRWALFLGLALCVGALAFSSLFLWDIRVTGNTQVPTEIILRELRRCGVGIGAFSPALEPRFLKHEMLLALDDLSFITINIRGSRADVEVREREKLPEVVPKEEPCNLVAARTGVVSEVRRYEGATQVQVGQAVLEGELLVSGVMDVEPFGYRYVHAEGMIYADTWNTLTCKTPKEALRKTYTGDTTVRWALVLGERRINLYFDSGSPYSSCDKISQVTKLKLTDSFPLPIALVREEYRETALTESELTREEALKLLDVRLHEVLETETGNGIVLEEEGTVTQQRGAWVGELFALVEENIAKEQALPTPEYTDPEPDAATGE